jgi:serine/threonine-protein kinase
MSHDSLTTTAPVGDLEVLLTHPIDRQVVCGRVVCPGVLTVGRKPTARVVLPDTDRQAARLHFDIDLQPAYCLLTNHSKLGTFVNGLLVQTQCDLEHGDLIRASQSKFMVQVLRGGEPAEVPRAPTVLWQAVSDSTNSAEATSPTKEALPLPPALLTLQQLPGYRLIRRLGNGAMGTVWLAENSAGQLTACKLIRPELALDREKCERFRRETNHLRDLKHRHIVGFREAGEYQGLLYLVMDYVDGCDLSEMLRQQGPFGVARALRLTCQVLEALWEAHSNGVVHRDVKPSNILVQSGPCGEEIRLADFGLAKSYQAADIVKELTLPGVAGGTLAFAAPEMVTDFRRAGPLADQFGAAATLYNMLTACHLHDAVNTAQLLDCIRTQNVVTLSRRRPGLPVELSDAIHRALHHQPSRRFPTVRHLRDVLLPYAEGTGNA